MGDTGLTAPVVVTASVLRGADDGMSIDERLHHTFAAEPSGRIHLYGMDTRSDASVIGHVTMLGDDCEKVRSAARRAASMLRDGPRTTTA